jgi:hypothetical protein
MLTDAQRQLLKIEWARAQGNTAGRTGLESTVSYSALSDGSGAAPAQYQYLDGYPSGNSNGDASGGKVRKPRKRKVASESKRKVKNPAINVIGQEPTRPPVILNNAQNSGAGKPKRKGNGWNDYVADFAKKNSGGKDLFKRASEARKAGK